MTLYNGRPTIGLVIGTFGAVPFIHLQLEARKRFYSRVPTLVHDDASNKYNILRRLCNQYGVDFSRNDIRKTHGKGDLTAFVSGLKWARDHGLDILLKLSRRFLFLEDWTSSLIELAEHSQYATFGSYSHSDLPEFGFRTECVAMSVVSWLPLLENIDVNTALNPGREIWIEGFLHGFAKGLEDRQCEQANRWRSCHPVCEYTRGYALWEFMGTDRRVRVPQLLWQICCPHDMYFRQASSWGLPYGIQEFVDPNQGEGHRDE
jgi:hypothetical protein